ncbi:YncE family protein [Rufibacter sp. LB8]|uniref:YncE family protein n=1 Tax=Rufibacter sp. LB8 TaxID=2777781 RepID=UPI00178C248E|nr:YncE family protein [Rufibacter sp. LB8]
MKKLFFQKHLLTAALSTLFFATSCDENPAETEPTILRENSVYIVNEGSYGTPNAEVSYISADGKTFVPDLFDKANDRPLGDAAQSMIFVDDKAYVVLNASNKIEIVNANTFQSLGDISGLQIPRYMAAASNTKAYVTEYVGYSFAGYTGTGRVSVLDLATKTVTKTIPVGLLPEGILLHNNKVYVANGGGTTVSVINTTTDAIEKEIEIGESPKHLVVDASNKIWVLRGGYTSPGALVKIDPANNYAVTSYPFPAGTSGPGQLAINGEKNKLVFGYGGKVYTMATNANALPTAALLHRDAYGLGVDPTNGNIYIGVGGYTTNGWAVRYQPSGTVIDSFQVRILPNGFLFR